MVLAENPGGGCTDRGVLIAEGGDKRIAQADAHRFGRPAHEREAGPARGTG